MRARVVLACAHIPRHRMRAYALMAFDSETITELHVLHNFQPISHLKHLLIGSTASGVHGSVI